MVFNEPHSVPQRLQGFKWRIFLETMHCLVRREQDGKELKETRVTQMAGTQRAWASDTTEMDKCD